MDPNKPNKQKEQKDLSENSSRPIIAVAFIGIIVLLICGCFVAFPELMELVAACYLIGLALLVFLILIEAAFMVSCELWDDIKMRFKQERKDN